MRSNALAQVGGRFWGLGKTFSSLWRHASRLLLFVALSLSVLHSVARADAYILGPQDVLKIRVFEWRPNAGVAFEWVPLTGDFAISAAGNLSLPIIGTIPVAGKTSEEVAQIIGDLLQKQIGLQKQPQASVEISAYRPFFVTGLVSSPGKYNYIPGLTVVQALSMAGGSGRADTNMIGLQRDALVNRGTLRELEVERLALLARQARVEAVLDNQATIKFPEDLASRANQSVVAQIINGEQALLDTRLRSIKLEVEALGQAKVLASNQLEALRLKEASLAKQIELANKDLTSVNKLVSQGLTLSSRQLGANQNVADLESRNLDVSLAIVKTQQDLAKLDQDITEVHEKFKAATLSEATELRDRLAANFEKAKTAHALLTNIEVNAPAALAAEVEEDRFAFVTTVSRSISGIMTNMVVKDDDLVEPGDVIRVTRRETDHLSKAQLPADTQ